MKKSRQFATILYCEEEQKLFDLKINSLGKFRALAASPVHSPDLTEEDKQREISELQKKFIKKLEKLKDEKKIKNLQKKFDEELEKLENKQLKKHIHLLILTNYPVSATCVYTHLETIIPEEYTYTQVQPVSDSAAYFRYLTHLDDWDKEQFSDKPKVIPEGFKFGRGRGKHSLSPIQKEKILQKIAKTLVEKRISPSLLYYNSEIIDDLAAENVELIRKNFTFFLNFYRDYSYFFEMNSRKINFKEYLEWKKQ